MKYTTALIAAAGSASALTQQCGTGTPVEEGGNYFCAAVEHILYQGLIGKGSYDSVTGMTSGGDCQRKPKAYNGPLAPLDEGLSIHVRGPISLKNAAVYNIAHKKRDNHAHNHAAIHHNHQLLHEQKKAKRDMITATIDGQVVSWVNNWAAPTAAPANKPAVAAAANSKPADSKPADSKPADSHANKNTGSKAIKSSGGDWNRVSFYDAEKQIAENMVFLGNYGGSDGSGVWDMTWGSSLSYLNPEGNGGAATSQILQDVHIPSNKEFAIFSGDKCTPETCGFARAKDVAYQGFAGANKVFVFRFKMPMDGKRGFNGDMPALWMLNQEIPQSAQYGSCSPWTTGAGEFDIYEVLASGDDKCKSTFHLKNGAGSSDYFKRPTDDFINVAVVFHEESASVSIKEIADDFDFSEGLDDETVRGWISSGSDSALSSLFQLLG